MDGARDEGPRPSARPDESVEDQRLLALLACYDDALVEGIAPAADPALTKNLDAAFSDRLERNEAVVNLLVRAGMTSAASGTIESIERVADEPTTPLTGPSLTADAKTPKKIGRFEIRRELGRGGLGVVFLAFDPVLKRNVALKLPRPEALVTPELRRRFLREAQAVARLAHPHLVPAFEAGELGPLIYLASNYVEGPTLAAWLAERSEPPTQELSAEWIAVLADAVHYAHGQGVLHRDITPSNVILVPPSKEKDQPPGADGAASFTPMLVDFGLAKVEGSTSIETRAGLAMGTLGYMAPEQAQGQLDAIGPATDVHALGAVLYHLLTGKPPFTGPSTAAALHSMFANDLVAPRQANRAVARDLEAICLKCLEDRPARRYPTAGELATDLRRFLSGEPTVARPLSVVQILGRWVRWRPMTAALVAVSCLAVVTIVSGSAFYSWRLAAALDGSEQRRLEAVAMRAEADTQRRHAVDERDANERLLYASRMRLADQLLGQGDVEEASRILARYEEGTPLSGLRGFEWHYLTKMLHGERLTLRGHRGEVYGVTFSPDGKLVVSGGEDGSIKLWDAASGREVRTLEAHASCTNSVAFSPDGHRLASSSCDKTVKLWNPATWSVEQTLTVHRSEVLSLAFSPDGTYLAAGGKDGSICIWTLPQCRLIQQLKPANTTVDVVTFSPDGKLLAAGIGTKGVYLWKVGSWTEPMEFPYPSVAVAFTPDSKQILVGDAHNGVVLCDVETAKVRTAFAGRLGQVQHIVVSPSGRLLATAGGSGALTIWNLEEIQKGAAPFVAGSPAAGMRNLAGHNQRAQCVAFSPDSANLATASFDGTVKLWGLPQGDGPAPVLECPAAIQRQSRVTAALSRDLGRMTLAGGEQKIEVWDLPKRQRIAAYDAPIADFFALSPNGSQFIAATGAGFDFRDAAGDVASTHHFGAQFGLSIRVAFSPSGRTLAVIGEDGHLYVWDVPSWKERSKPQLVAPRIVGSPRQIIGSRMPHIIMVDDDRLVIIDRQERIVFDLATGQRRVSRGDEVGELANIACSPVAPLVAAVNYGPIVQLIDCQTGHTAHALHLTEPAHAAAFSPDGRTLVTGSREGRLVLWHAPTGQEMMTLRTPPGNILAMRFSEDGRSLGAVVQHADGQNAGVYLWSAESQAPPD